MRVRSGYPSDVSDEGWAFIAPYLTLMDEQAPQRAYSLRAIFNALRYLARTGQAWRYVPNDLPPWQAVYQQCTRWRDARCFETLVDDVSRILRLAEGRLAEGRTAEPTAVILDSRTLQSTPESGSRAGYDGAKRRKGRKVHVTVDTLGHLLAAHVTLAYVDQGEGAAAAARAEGMELEVVKLDHIKKGFVLLPKRWVGKRSFGWAARFRRLARDYERLLISLQQLHFLVFSVLMLARANSLNLLNST